MPLRVNLLTCEQHTILEDTLHHFQKLVFHTLRAATRALLSSMEGKGNTRSGMSELSSKLSFPPDVYCENLLPVAYTNSSEPF